MDCDDCRVEALEWSHNAYYQRVILRQLPRRSVRVLDVGCGAGSLAARLAERFAHVDAIDSSPVMIDAARRRTPPNVNCVLGDVMTEPFRSEQYDAIVSLTVLHHLPIREALMRLAEALRPGGVLVAVALPRTDLPRELPVELLAAVAHRGLGLGFAVARKVSGASWYSFEETDSVMPKNLEPALSTHQVRAAVRETLPGSRVRRLVFWRYLIRWQRPGVTESARRSGL